MTDADRDFFDQQLEQVLADLPKPIAALLEQVPLIVEDEPSPQLRRELELDADDDLFGLHTGIALTEKSVEDHAALPDQIMLFRAGLYRHARQLAASTRPKLDVKTHLAQQIRITVLHEIGHHFGLDEQQLQALGYG